MKAPAAARPALARTLTGRTARLVPLDRLHADALFDAAGGAANHALWRYMAERPRDTREGYRQHVAALADHPGTIAFAIFAAAGEAAEGYACYMRVEPQDGCLEIGNILFVPALARTTAATDALHLLLRHAFEDLGYRRVEWKCDTRNGASHAAALRLGFAFEGTFRQHRIVRGENRDTAWFAMLDRDWPLCRAAFETWLAPDNFGADGRQHHGLAAVRRRATATE